MKLARYSAFPTLDNLQRQMSRLFDDEGILNWPDVEGRFYIPSAEICETEDAIELKLEVPGIDAKELDIQVSQDKVAISGERKEEKTTDGQGFTRSEFRYGSFQRVIPLPRKVKNDAVNANYKDGILRLTLPKADEEKVKVVKVNIEEGNA